MIAPAPLPNRWWRAGAWGAAAALLIAAAIARQTVPGFNWTAADFIGVGTVLGLACLAWEIAMRRAASDAYRAAAALTIAGTLGLAWINLAVGIIGSEDNPANLVFFAVPAIGGSGAILTRLNPAGMARTLAIMALVQAAIAAGNVVFALVPAAVLGGFFAGLWAIAATLFRKAAGELRQRTA
ncbi:MAG: hypothetical protein RIQ99_2051 [Pseudomonadota bacterium]|jgi:hypothetical protein